MTTINSFFNSPTATTSLLHAFMAQSQAATLQSLSFFSGGLGGADWGSGSDSVDFSQTTLDSSLVMSLIQGGNTELFGRIYKDADAFNQSLMSSVSAAAGLHFSDDSLLGQLVNQLA